MKFTKRQKETIKRISEGTVFDIFSYLKAFDLGKNVKYDKEDVLKKFQEDGVCKEYYCPKELARRQGTTLGKDEYQKKLASEQLDPEQYVSEKLKLNFNTGIRTEIWENKNYVFDFYEGIYVANSIDDILDFLVLWQYLKSQMLVLEMPQDCTTKTLGLFFESADDNRCSFGSIDYNDLSYSDGNYLKGNIYTLSHDHCVMCQEYLHKRIIPSPTLMIFIKRGYKTPEERAQANTLLAAWLAIAISIISLLVPNFRQNRDSNAQTEAVGAIMLSIDNVSDQIVEHTASSREQHNMDHAIALLAKINDCLKKILDSP